LSKLTNASSISLSNNQFTGSIPKSLGQLEDLDLLDLGHNKLTGTIPSEMVGMVNIQYLYLNDNHLSGAIPSEIGSLTDLIYLYLSHNQLSGQIPDSLMNLTNIYESTLDIGYNCLEASGLALRAWLDNNDPDWEDHQNDCGGVPIITTSPVLYITDTTASSGGEVIQDGGFSVIARGVCWKTSSNPTLLNTHTNDGSGMGTFYSNLPGLLPGRTYYIKAWATNATGTGYGGELTFTTTGGSNPVINAALILLLED
jgi:hypothetical protein